MDISIYGQSLLCYLINLTCYLLRSHAHVCVCVCLKFGLTSDLWRRSSLTTLMDSGIRILIKSRGTSRRWRMGWTYTHVPLDKINTHTHTHQLTLQHAAIHWCDVISCKKRWGQAPHLSHSSFPSNRWDKRSGTRPARCSYTSLRLHTADDSRSNSGLSKSV